MTIKSKKPILTEAFLGGEVVTVGTAIAVVDSRSDRIHRRTVQGFRRGSNGGVHIVDSDGSVWKGNGDRAGPRDQFHTAFARKWIVADERTFVTQRLRDVAARLRDVRWDRVDDDLLLIAVDLWKRIDRQLKEKAAGPHGPSVKKT